MSAAAALDAADGVIDGRHFGRPIVQAGPQFVQGGPQFFQGGPQFVQSAPQFVQAGPQFVQGGPQFVQGQQFVQSAPQFVQAAPQFASAYPASFGTQFAGTQFAGTQFAPQFASGFGAPTFVGGASSTAAALDAADGVIDGKHFGRQIVQAAPQVAFGGPSFGSFVGGQTFAPQFGQTFVGGASSTAAALDAADGVIDGRHFGRPIVQAGAPVIQGGLVPYTGIQQVQQAIPAGFAAAPSFNYGGAIPAQTYFGGQRFAGYGAPVASYGQAYPQAYGQTFGQGFVGAPVANYGFPQQFGAPAQSRAAQLDAADGVIDGKFYGRQIVQRR